MIHNVTYNALYHPYRPYPKRNIDKGVIEEVLKRYRDLRTRNEIASDLLISPNIIRDLICKHLSSKERAMIARKIRRRLRDKELEKDLRIKKYIEDGVYNLYKNKGITDIAYIARLLRASREKVDRLIKEIDLLG